jgi:Zn-dependent alcohol dehydrogenase
LTVCPFFFTFVGRGSFDHRKKVDLAENSTVAVFGIGCVGLSILQGARAKGCKRVFAIDTNPSKEEWAKKFGASTSFSTNYMKNSDVNEQPTLLTLRIYPRERVLLNT